MTAIKAILFDCDGTLVDTEEISSAACADALKPFGVTMTAEEVNHDYIGVHLDDIIDDIQERFGVEIDFPKFLSLYRDGMLTNVPNHIRILPDTHDYIKSLHDRGIKMTVGSNGVRDVVKAELGEVDLLKFFTTIITADDVANAKPHPQMYLEGMKAVGVDDPKACIVVEDSITGVKAGVAGGMLTIGYTGLNPNPVALEQKLLKSGAHKVIKSLSELDFLL